MNGLTQQQVAILREKYGLNILATQNKRSWLRIFFNQFTDTLIIILIIAAIISTFHDITESMVIIIIVLLNGAIGFFQEFRTEKTLEALNNMISPSIRVMRDGQEQMIETQYLVPGDIVILAEGDKIPADGILQTANHMRVEESALTGESVAVEKHESDLVYMGTSIARGSGIIQVQFIGVETEFGKIAQLTTETKTSISPIQKELSTIGIFVAKMTGIISLILMVVHVLRNMSGSESFFTTLVEGFIFAVSVAIAAVPEGLPTTITVALAIGASVLAKKKAIVKKLSSTETLGTVSTICTDKTGTLTKNEMTVRTIISSDGQTMSFDGVGYDPNNGQVLGDISDIREFQRIADIAYYCNEAKLISGEQGYEILGDPTEAALLTMAEKIYDYSSDDRTEYVQESLFPFDSDRKRMSVVATDTYEHSYVFVKGSPDHVLEHCTHYWDGTDMAVLTEEKITAFRKHYDNLAKQALRVLAVAYKSTTQHPETMEHAESDLIFAGLVGMIDPPRDDVKQAIKQTKAAGIRTIVITGDYGVTASVIAQELGIVDDHHRVITGDELSTISDTDLHQILADRTHQVIFARSQPAQKMRIVEALQYNGEVVAMTGDGVNDAPALKRADIGVAMGITGTEVSKEAATLVLLDDSFSTIVRAVREGRRIYDNLKKFVLYTLSSNVGELLVIFISILSGIPLILTAVLILTVNLGTDILPAIALGVDPADDDVMQRKPRDPQQRVLDRSFIVRLFTIGGVIGISVIIAFVYTLIGDGWQWGQEFSDETLRHGQTVAFATLVIIQLVNVFSIKNNRPMRIKDITGNMFLLLSIIISVLLTLLIMYIPFLNNALKIVPLSLYDWGVVLIMSFVPVAMLELVKYIQSKKTT